MKPEQFIREWGLPEAKRILEEAPKHSQFVIPCLDGEMYFSQREDDGKWFKWSMGYSKWLEYFGKCNPLDLAYSLSDLKRLVESLDRFNKFEDKQEALDAIDDAPEGATDYRKLSCGTRYIKQGPRFFEYWNGSGWCRPTVPFTVETHILRFDKLEDLKQSIKDHESIYGGGE
ncbi:hypothetical protein K5F35_19780 [Acinetobacter baumannii]|uniref:hypothetical protein n=1 Tax=Acinetobacter calcoaceticus/baumannii complex TaxID=909768 RepID=UPI000DE68263|nr:hypothetical protein [Acinetobacter baumannii]MCJ9206328.1 hypothetical protein [Acinetobacter baumannii]MCJ9332128.1 hypothetical protein [Acinetobacter baumannii]MCJ9527932.1 hypothetical protein [Acinetobacter baumannii]MCJ9531878.1 hypothetical protein [Acinetobacter baumannii]SSR39989.1 Uncharacterised protein [Acinetobacter baumannii]